MKRRRSGTAKNGRADERRVVGWADIVNFTIAAVALVLGVVTFYYQFMRETRGLTAQVLHGQLEDGQYSLVVIVRNTGSRDEVVHEASVVVEGQGGIPLVSRPVFPIGVVKPGEAKRVQSGEFDFTKMVKSDDYRWAARNLAPPPRHHPLALRIVVVDERGVLIETRRVLGDVQVGPTGSVSAGYGTRSGEVLDLLKPHAVSPR